MKRELAKKEGRLLTKKQKEAKAAAEARRNAPLQAGVVIAGLQEDGPPADKPKKVVYGKKKKPAASAANKTVTGSTVSTPTTAVAELPEVKELSPKAEAAVIVRGEEEEKDDWDVSSQDESKPDDRSKEGVKDSWDASSSDGEKKKKAAVPTKPGMFLPV